MLTFRIKQDLTSIRGTVTIINSLFEDITEKDFKNNYFYHRTGAHLVGLIGESISQINEHSPHFISGTFHCNWFFYITLSSFIFNKPENLDYEVIWQTIKTEIPKLLNNIDNFDFHEIQNIVNIDLINKDLFNIFERIELIKRSLHGKSYDDFCNQSFLHYTIINIFSEICEYITRISRHSPGSKNVIPNFEYFNLNEIKVKFLNKSNRYSMILIWDTLVEFLPKIQDIILSLDRSFFEKKDLIHKDDFYYWPAKCEKTVPKLSFENYA